jgi:hypothetical protein
MKIDFLSPSNLVIPAISAMMETGANFHLCTSCHQDCYGMVWAVEKGNKK